MDNFPGSPDDAVANQSHPKIFEQTSGKTLKVHTLLSKKQNILTKEIRMMLRLFLAITMYCQGSSSQIKSINQPLPLLAGWEGSLGTCSR